MKSIAIAALIGTISGVHIHSQWVELPNCPGTISPAKPLAADLSNASWATCKPAGPPVIAKPAVAEPPTVAEPPVGAEPPAVAEPPAKAAALV